MGTIEQAAHRAAAAAAGPAEPATPTIAVLVPCYNEEVAIGKVVRDFRAALPQATVYVYDNNSKDNTRAVAAEAGAVVRGEPLQGKGNVVHRMFGDIEADIYVLVDGDDTYDAAAAPQLIELLETEMQQQADEIQAITVAAERARLAREMHDDLGSKLVLINLELQLAAELAAEDPVAARDHLVNSREMLHSAWRNLLAVVDANLPVHSETLVADLRQLAMHCAHSTRSRVELDIQGRLDQLTAAVAHCIYRAVQEGLTNACKHARASVIVAQVKSEGDCVVVTITNDDQPDRTLPAIDLGSGSFGLIGLRERVEALGGGFEAGPLPDGGWRLRLVLPTEHKE